MASPRTTKPRRARLIGRSVRVSGSCSRLQVAGPNVHAAYELLRRPTGGQWYSQY
jgi:hypothetical protein